MYDVIAALVHAGLVRRIGPAGSPPLFELRGADNHHHLGCRICGALEDVDCVRGEAPCLTPSVTKGFIVDEAEVTFWGTCTSCAETAGGLEAPSTNKEN
jgi:Fur family ferric uptake transcriptional regulator